MNLAIRQLGFDPQALMGRLKTVGLVRVDRRPLINEDAKAAAERFRARQKAGLELKTVKRPELKGLQGAAYHRAYRKLMYAQLKARRK